MGELVNLKEYKEKVINKEIAEMRKELEAIMSSWPETEGSGFFLSLEEMERIERIWVEEKSKK
jgi:hypothetical protein